MGVYQGGTTLMAGFVEPYITEAILQEITACGGVMIMAISLNMLRITKIRIENVLLGMLVAAVWAANFM